MTHASRVTVPRIPARTGRLCLYRPVPRRDPEQRRAFNARTVHADLQYKDVQPMCYAPDRVHGDFAAARGFEEGPPCPSDARARRLNAEATAPQPAWRPLPRPVLGADAVPQGSALKSSGEPGSDFGQIVLFRCTCSRQHGGWHTEGQKRARARSESASRRRWPGPLTSSVRRSSGPPASPAC